MPVSAVINSRETLHARGESRAPRRVPLVLRHQQSKSSDTNMLMLAHSAARPLWPVVFFVPWLLLGVSYLIEAVRHRHP
jgi:hypothetical protein